MLPNSNLSLVYILCIQVLILAAYIACIYYFGWVIGLATWFVSGFFHHLFYRNIINGCNVAAEVTAPAINRLAFKFGRLFT